MTIVVGNKKLNECHLILDDRCNGNIVFDVDHNWLAASEIGERILATTQQLHEQRLYVQYKLPQGAKQWHLIFLVR